MTSPEPFHLIEVWFTLWGDSFYFSFKLTPEEAVLGVLTIVLAYVLVQVMESWGEADE